MTVDAGLPERLPAQPAPCWPSPSPHEPVTLRLAAERRKPQVTIRQLLVARIEEGVIKYQATFFYSILYSGVKSLRIDVPADVAELAAQHHRRASMTRGSIRRPPTWIRAWSRGA